MCGIVGYVGHRQASPILLEGLSRLEYRGYDSAGIAILDAQGIRIQRAEGKLSHLKKIIGTDASLGKIGIGHTRWATHGRPSEANAHPHRHAEITIVHNGIIENYRELREDLLRLGHVFSSETDSEILAHQIAEALKNTQGTRQALQVALDHVRGSYAVALLNEQEPDKIYAARDGSPLVIGLGEGENFLASDVPALLPFTKRVIFLEEGEMACLSADQVEIWNRQGEKISRQVKEISWTLEMAEKGGYPHFMLKEIFEQPQALTDTLRGYLDPALGRLEVPEMEALFRSSAELKNLDKIYLIACGTSWHAALVGRYALEQFLKIPVMVEQASEFRYRDPLVDARTLIIAVSQSGETADTLVALRQAKLAGAKILSISNVVESSIARESHVALYTRSGPEIGVAATKTFTSQLLALLLVALDLSRRQEISKQDLKIWVEHLLKLPGQVEGILRQSAKIQQIALRYQEAKNYLFIGRGPLFPIALEGALKLKEISYLHAEGYPAGELKHGPIAMIEAGTPVISFVIKDKYYEKMLSNIQEVLSRRASVIAIANEDDQEIMNMASEVMFLPQVPPLLTPILAAIPLQLFAYFIAAARGHDIDQPRNLAKSVTVE